MGPRIILEYPNSTIHIVIVPVPRTVQATLFLSSSYTSTYERCQTIVYSLRADPSGLVRPLSPPNSLSLTLDYHQIVDLHLSTRITHRHSSARSRSSFISLVLFFPFIMIEAANDFIRLAKCHGFRLS